MISAESLSFSHAGEFALSTSEQYLDETSPSTSIVHWIS